MNNSKRDRLVKSYVEKGYTLDAAFNMADDVIILAEDLATTPSTSLSTAISKLDVASQKTVRSAGGEKRKHFHLKPDAMKYRDKLVNDPQWNVGDTNDAARRITDEVLRLYGAFDRSNRRIEPRQMEATIKVLVNRARKTPQVQPQSQPFTTTIRRLAPPSTIAPAFSVKR